MACELLALISYASLDASFRTASNRSTIRATPRSSRCCRRPPTAAIPAAGDQSPEGCFVSSIPQKQPPATTALICAAPLGQLLVQIGIGQGQRLCAHRRRDRNRDGDDAAGRDQTTELHGLSSSRMRPARVPIVE